RRDFKDSPPVEIVDPRLAKLLYLFRLGVFVDNGLDFVLELSLELVKDLLGVHQAGFRSEVDHLFQSVPKRSISLRSNSLMASSRGRVAAWKASIISGEASGLGGSPLT